MREIELILNESSLIQLTPESGEALWYYTCVAGGFLHLVCTGVGDQLPITSQLSCGFALCSFFFMPLADGPYAGDVYYFTTTALDSSPLGEF